VPDLNTKKRRQPTGFAIPKQKREKKVAKKENMEDVANRPLSLDMNVESSVGILPVRESLAINLTNNTNNQNSNNSHSTNNSNNSLKITIKSTAKSSSKTSSKSSSKSKSKGSK
jgi:hypothetical protein